jgi:hypothetical protein
MGSRCVVCGKHFQRNGVGSKGRPPEACSSKCRRVRKARWQRAKMLTDSDYRLNQKSSWDRWKQAHPEYWKEYRKRRAEYTESNRQKQRLRNKARSDHKMPHNPMIAKMDGNGVQPFENSMIMSGRYILRPLNCIAKMDEIAVQLFVLS